MTPLEPTNGNRTHEPSLRELTAQLDDIKELLQVKHDALVQIVDERDRLYDVRFRAAEAAVGAALAAQEKGTNAAFNASEKAISKAEDAQREYNIRSNEFRGQLDDQAKTLMPRPETTSLFQNVDDKINTVRSELNSRIEALIKDIASLRESRSESGGKSLGTHAVIAYVIAAISIILALLGFASRFIN
jgi:hypothetical protein